MSLLISKTALMLMAFTWLCSNICLFNGIKIFYFLKCIYHGVKQLFKAILYCSVIWYKNVIYDKMTVIL